MDQSEKDLVNRPQLCPSLFSAAGPRHWGAGGGATGSNDPPLLANVESMCRYF